ncbi:MAG: flagellar motor protein MotA [Myxococcales bacterium]|nr:flagellar motor protein MotA [Myxococcales bacterium]
MDFSLVNMVKEAGWPARFILIILLIMSVYFLAVAVERLLKFTKARRLALEFVLGLRDKLKARDIKGTIALARVEPRSPIAVLVGSALEEYEEGMDATHKKGPDEIGEFDIVDAVNRAIERSKEREIADLRRGLSGLATIASAAPFVGLLGTVLGIITVFGKMKTEGGGIQAVAGGIGEALVTTAFGLLVAIPSVMVFNYFTNRVDDFIVDMNDVSSELISFVLKEGRDKTGAPGSGQVAAKK